MPRTDFLPFTAHNTPCLSKSLRAMRIVQHSYIFCWCVESSPVVFSLCGWFSLIFCTVTVRAGHATMLPRQRDHVFRPHNRWLDVYFRSCKFSREPMKWTTSAFSSLFILTQWWWIMLGALTIVSAISERHCLTALFDADFSPFRNFLFW